MTDRWKKSSYSDNAAGCVEIARSVPVVGIRDSKHPTGPALLLPPTALDALLTFVR